MPSTLLESFIANVNANVFFPEFTFAATEFAVPGHGQLELADHFVLLGEAGMIFQLKERDEGADGGLDAVLKWFDNKVQKKAVTQLRDTRAMLQQYAGMQLYNQAGHRVQVDPPDIEGLVGVVVYRCPVRLPSAPRVYLSRSAGLVHFIPDQDYATVCRVLKTPTEILEYLTFRAAVVMANAEASAAVSEKALVGQFLVEEGGLIPSSRFEAVFEAWRDDESTYDLSYFLRQLGSRVIYREGGDRSDTSHYSILREFARMSRVELAHFKRSFRLALDAVRADRYEPPYRLGLPRIGCGFAIVPLTSEMAPDARRWLMNIGNLSKHVFGTSRHLSCSIVRRDGALDIEWMHVTGAPEPNEALDARLAEYSPLRPSSTQTLPRYWFDSETLQEIITG